MHVLAFAFLTTCIFVFWLDDARDVELKAFGLSFLGLKFINEAEHRNLLSLFATSKWLAAFLEQVDGLA